MLPCFGAARPRWAPFLKQALRRLLGFHEGPAIFAGDTNLREPEVKQEQLAKEVIRDADVFWIDVSF